MHNCHSLIARQESCFSLSEERLIGVIPRSVSVTVLLYEVSKFLFIASFGYF